MSPPRPHTNLAPDPRLWCLMKYDWESAPLSVTMKTNSCRLSELSQVWSSEKELRVLPRPRLGGSRIGLICPVSKGG